MSDDEEELDDLPDFANAPNRALYAELKDAERALAATEEELAETGERVSVMEGHLGSVVAERQNTQRLVDAKAKEVETEDHLKQLADRELGRFSSELSKLQRECADLTDKATAAQTQIFKGNERMDAFKLQMNWKQEELEQWALAARQKEEDNLAMLKYAKADESRLKSLNLQLEKTLAQVAERQAELETEVTKTSVQQVELDRTADDYRALQRERRELVEQWEMSVAAMQKRDEDISRAHEEYASAKRELEAQQEALAQKESELEARQKSNADLRHGIASAERAVGRRREEQRAAAEATESVQEQVAQARVALSEAAAERDKRRAQIRGAEESLEERRAALEAAKAKLAAAEEAASRSSDNLGSLEAASKQMDELHAREGARLKERAKAAGALREALYAETARLQAARQAEARLAADIAGAERLLRNSRYRVGQLDEKAQRQREVLYTADFQLQLMQRKVARATGVRSAEEQTELKSQIATLQRQLEQQGATARMLSEQEKRLSNELKRARRREEEVTTEEARLWAAIDAVEVDNTLAQKQIKKEAQQRQEATVAADLLRLEVKKLREALHGRTDGVFGLENRKSQLQLSMAERQEEIKVHTDVLRAQLKAAEDERSRAKKALTERLLRVDRLSAKSANLEGKLGTDEDGAPQSQVYLVIKAAQERDELQRQGDELDAKIQTAEREVVSLDKALRHLVDKNAAYKAALAPAGPRTPLAEQRALLEEQHRAALARCRAHKVQQSEVEEEIGQMGVTLDELADVSGAQRQHYERLADASRSIGATLQERRGELQRVASELSSLLDAHRASAAASGVQGATALEREAALSERLVANRTTLERLAALSAEDASFGPALESLCAQAGVPPPEALPGDE